MNGYVRSYLVQLVYNFNEIKNKGKKMKYIAAGTNQKEKKYRYDN